MMPEDLRAFPVKDPVCGKTVDMAEAANKREYEEFEDWAYFFCSAACRKTFLKAPGRYADRPRMSGSRGQVEGRR